MVDSAWWLSLAMLVASAGFAAFGLPVIAVHAVVIAVFIEVSALRYEYRKDRGRS